MSVRDTAHAIGTAKMQAELRQPEQRVHHQEDQRRRQHDPQQKRRIKRAAPQGYGDGSGGDFGVAHATDRNMRVN
jgi:hypothetical protein